MLSRAKTNFHAMMVHDLSCVSLADGDGTVSLLHHQKRGRVCYSSARFRSRQAYFPHAACVAVCISALWQELVIVWASSCARHGGFTYGLLIRLNARNSIFGRVFVKKLTLPLDLLAGFLGASQ